MWLLIYMMKHKPPKILISKFLTTRNNHFYSLCFIMYINNHNSCDTVNFTVCFITTLNWKCATFWCIKINIEFYDKTRATTIPTIYSVIDKQAQTTNTISTTALSDDFIYWPIIFNIDIHTSKQPKKAITDIGKSNDEIYSVIGAVVIDIHQRRQTAKT